MKRIINTSTYNFEDVIKHNLLYVDKTRYFYQLVAHPKNQFFISRPRRFGKSLTISALDCIFRGKKELFKNLYIGSSDYDWQVYPVINLNLTQVSLRTVNDLESGLLQILRSIAAEYQVDIVADRPSLYFSMLIQALYQKNPQGVVLLIDEYDRPLFQHIEDEQAAEEFRAMMEDFYQMIKGNEKCFRFVFLTGVTKFAKVSIFSKMNNLTDISLTPEFANMFGITQKEFEENYREHLEDAITANVHDNYGNILSYNTLIDEIKRWYNGFRFVPGADTVYNPVSLGLFFFNGNVFRSYWFETGTPSFLLKLIKKNHLTILDVEKSMMSDFSFGTFNVVDLSKSKVANERILQMLFQTGYLTIDKQLLLGGSLIYTLRFPNFEVQDAFEMNLFDTMSDAVGSSSITASLKVAALEGNTEEMIEILQDVFANIPYDIQVKREKYYQSLVYLIFMLAGIEILTEVKTNVGSIDGVMKQGQHIYIIEFKLNKDSDIALQQIDSKKYSEKYLLPAKKDGKTIHLLGINFCHSDDVRNITDWKEVIG